MNHVLNAQLHKLPACPECNASVEAPCRTDRNAIREPHRSRMAVKNGELTPVDVARGALAAVQRAKELDAIRVVLSQMTPPLKMSKAAKLELDSAIAFLKTIG